MTTRPWKLLTVIAGVLGLPGFYLLLTGGQILPRAQERRTGESVQWTQLSASGIPFSLARNVVVRHPVSQVEMQAITLFLEPQYFTEESLKKVFLQLAGEFAHSHELSITAMSDSEAVHRVAEDSTTTSILCSFSLAPDDAFQSARDPAVGFFRASYRRSSGWESFYYNPNPNRAENLYVTLKTRPIPYTGELNQDLLLAIRSRDIGKAMSLLSTGANVNATDKDHKTPLIVAALARETGIVTALLGRGARVNARDTEGWTALLIAASNGDTNMVDSLLSTAADARAKRLDGASALQIAAGNGHEDTVRLLLRHGAELDGQDRDGNTALISAAANARVGVTKVLLSAGAAVDATNNLDETALMLAHNHYDLLTALLSHGANVNSGNKNADTALMYAVRSRHVDKARLLIEKGADVNAKNRDGVSILQLARREYTSPYLLDLRQIIELLVKAGAKA